MMPTGYVNSPMNEEHDWEAASGQCIDRTRDVEVQTLELVLLEGLGLNRVLGQTEELLLITLGLRLRAYGTTRRERSPF